MSGIFPPEPTADWSKTAPARGDHPIGTRIAGGFAGPMGTLLMPSGEIWLIDSGFGGALEVRGRDFETGEDTLGKVGPTSRIVRLDATGQQTTVVRLMSARIGGLVYGGNRLVELDGTIYGTGSLWPRDGKVPVDRIPSRSLFKLVDIPVAPPANAGVGVSQTQALSATAAVQTPKATVLPAAVPLTEYIVKRGDNCSRIVKGLGIVLTDLIVTNGLNRDCVIVPGQRLKLPAPQAQRIGVGQAKPQLAQAVVPTPTLLPTDVANTAVQNSPQPQGVPPTGLFPQEVVNFTEFEETHNPDHFAVDTNPFGLARTGDGELYVTDAAGNTLYRVNPKTGTIKLVAVFGGVARPIANPNRNDLKEADPVPTGVTVDAAGNVYVAFLTGIPFTQGTAKVVKVDKDGTVTDFATDMTTLMDVQVGPDGHVYAMSGGAFTTDGRIIPNTGKLLRLWGEDRFEVVMGDLSFPTSMTFTPEGDVYVTTMGGGPGPGELWLYKNIAPKDG